MKHSLTFECMLKFFEDYIDPDYFEPYQSWKLSHCDESRVQEYIHALKNYDMNDAVDDFKDEVQRQFDQLPIDSKLCALSIWSKDLERDLQYRRDVLNAVKDLRDDLLTSNKKDTQ